uniref:Uncharacterized protein n=1 Tax=Panthera leo TaxID=9689 RepID=A0A8C8XKB2_PANLE
VTMRSLWLLRTPFICGLLWAFCALGTRAEEPGANFSHPNSMGLDKNTVHDQEHIMEYLEGFINKPEVEMFPQALQLHYFKLHDYDSNNLNGVNAKCFPWSVLHLQIHVASILESSPVLNNDLPWASEY